MAANLEGNELRGICNLGAIGDSMSNSAQPDSSNTSEQPIKEIIDLTGSNSEMNSNQLDADHLIKIQNIKNLRNGHQLRDQQNPIRTNEITIGQNNELSNDSYQNTQDLNNQIVQDFVLQNYLYDNLKTFPDDTKSMNSVMTSLSARKTFDFLSKVLPWGVVLLIVFLMIHFVLYVKDIEPLNKLTEIICIALAVVVFSLSSAFIVKIFCDSKTKQSWSQGWTQPYSEDYIYTSNSNLNDSYVYNNGVLEHCNLNLTPNTSIITQQPPVPGKKFNLINQISNEPTTQQENLHKKQLHYYIDTINNRIYATQLANLDDKTKRYTKINNPTIQPSIGVQRNQQSQLNSNQRINPYINQHSRSNSFNQQHFSKIIDDEKITNQNQNHLFIQTINFNENKFKDSVTYKETST